MFSLLRNLKFILMIQILLSSLTLSKMIVVLDSKFEDCMAEKNRMNVFDFTRFEFVPINDTDTFMNGTWKFNFNIKSPWRFEIHLQKYDRGEWLLQMKKTYIDLCPELVNILNPANYFMKDIPKCTIKAETEAYFDMVSTQPPEELMKTCPPTMAGRYRALLYSEFKDGGKTLKDCHQTYFDLYEI